MAKIKKFRIFFESINILFIIIVIILVLLLLFFLNNNFNKNKYFGAQVISTIGADDHEPNQPTVLQPTTETEAAQETISPSDIVLNNLKFAIIGDYGVGGRHEASVAKLVKSWNPDFIVTTGDNNYDKGGADTIDKNIGKYYSDFIGNYHGKYGAGAPENKFFPAMGNHDWYTDNAKPYFDYFTLPGNERYYTFTKGPIQFFVLNSDQHEPDGINENSKQATWLKTSLAQSNACWKIVTMHHPPYDDGNYNTPEMRWPYSEWRASAVFAGHDHVYNRIIVQGINFVVEGLGGHPTKFSFRNNSYNSGSVSRYNRNFGALLGILNKNILKFKFVNINNRVIDQFEIPSKCVSVTPSPKPILPPVAIQPLKISFTNLGVTNNKTRTANDRFATIVLGTDQQKAILINSFKITFQGSALALKKIKLTSFRMTLFNSYGKEVATTKNYSCEGVAESNLCLVTVQFGDLAVSAQESRTYQFSIDSRELLNHDPAIIDDLTIKTIVQTSNNGQVESAPLHIIYK